MKHIFKISIFSILLFGMMVYFASCGKEPINSIQIQLTVKTDSVSGITQTSASSGGSVTSNGNSKIMDQGVCWNTSENPTTANNKTSAGTGTGHFISSLKGLLPNTKYFVRAYATNSAGTVYGNQVSFTTSQNILTSSVPTLTTTTVTTITLTSAASGGYITSDGGSPVTARGVCWGTTASPIIADQKTTDGTGTGSFTSYLMSLNPVTTYYIRAYAINSTGVAYGNQVSFTTTQAIPTITTTAVTSITSTNAASGGDITADGGSPVTARGVCWGTVANPTIAGQKTTDGTGTGIFTSNLTGLSPGTTYYLRAYALNNAGVAYGSQLSFTSSSLQGIGQKADFPGGTRIGAAGFSIGTKGYIGIGYGEPDILRRDFWEWDQSTNIWTRKADFPGDPQAYTVCFSIGTKGYIGTGGSITNSYTNEFWEYDPATNSWTQKASFPGTARLGAVGFSIGNKGYIGTGYDDRSNYAFQDFWEWDQATNVWTKKADFGGIARGYAVGFSIGTKGYIGTGAGGANYLKDFWEWDQVTNVWTKKADFGGIARVNSVSFSIGNKGYIGTGYDDRSNYAFQDFWEWDQATNVWTKKADFGGMSRSEAVGFSIGNKGYVGTGHGISNSNSVYGYLMDFWEYIP